MVKAARKATITITMNLKVKITTGLRHTVVSSRVSSLITALPAAMPFSSFAGFRFATAHSAFSALFTSLVPLPPPSYPGQRLYKELTGKSKFRAISHLITKACACLLASGVPIFLEELKATELAAYPFTKAQFDGGVDYSASQNNAATVVAGRTLIVTNELRNHVGDFQIDLAYTFSIAPTQTTINANNLDTATVYGASSSAEFLAGNYTPIFTIDIRNGYVNSVGGALQTVSTPAGPQFVQASDLGASFFGRTLYGISGATTAMQSQIFSNWLNTFSVGSTVAIGISFDLNSNDGILRVGSSNQNLGNSVLAFSSVLPFSSGFNIAPAIPEPTDSPSVLIHLTPTHSNLTLRHLTPGVLYRVKAGSDLVAWGEVHSLTGPANGEDVEWSELLVPTGPRFFRLEWDE